MENDYQFFLASYGFLLALAWTAFAIITGILASKKGKNVAGWVVLSLIIGILAIIILAFLNDESVRKSSRPIFYKTSTASNNKKICMNCGNTLSGPVCDMCGFTNIGGISSIPEKKDPAPAMPKKIEKYKCRECCQIIDTRQCPWCGAQKND